MNGFKKLFIDGFEGPNHNAESIIFDFRTDGGCSLIKDCKGQMLREDDLNKGTPSVLKVILKLSELFIKTPFMAFLYKLPS